MRLMRLIYLLVILLLVLFVVPASAENSRPFCDCLLEADEIHMVTDGKEEGQFSPHFTIDNISPIYDQEDNIYYFFLPEKDDLQNAVIQTTDCDLYIQQQKEDSMEWVYTLFFVNDVSYFQSTLVITSLPIMNIIYPDVSIESYYTPAHITLYSNTQSGEKEITDTEAMIKIRGGTSTRYPKKCYRIQLKKENGDKNKENFLGLRNDDDWVLYAAYNDQEKIRNVFASNLWFDSCAKNNPYGVTAGMEYRYIELFQNDRYWGIYALGYPVDSKQFKKGEEALRGLLKKSTLDISEKNVEINTEPLPGYEIKTEGCDEAALWHTLREIFYTADTSDSPSGIWQYIDENSAIDIFLFINFTQAVDNCTADCMRNMYYAIMDDGRLLYIPWDLDQTFGTFWGGAETHNYTTVYSVGPDYNNCMEINPVFRFITDNEIKTKIKERYSWLRQHEWSEEALLSRADEYEYQIYDTGAYERDRTRWPDGTYLEEGAKLSLFKEYIRERLVYMDAYIEGL